MATNDPLAKVGGKAVAEPVAKTPSGQPSATEVTTGNKYEPGFRADGTPYPGVEPDTGERKSVTWAGLREEFGDREGARLYNDIAVTGFGGVQASKPALSLLSLKDDRAVQFLDEDRLAKRVKRREKVLKLLADAETRATKEA